MKLSTVTAWVVKLNPALQAALAGACLLVILAGTWLAWSVINAPQRAATAKVAAHAAAVETQVGTAVAQKVIGVVQAGAARDQATEQKHQENSRALQSLPSANLAIPDADATAFAQRECMYDAERAGSSCAGLPQAGS